MRKQNRNFAPAHTICCEALAGKVKPRDYIICVPLKYRAARKTSAVPTSGRAVGLSSIRKILFYQLKTKSPSVL